MRVRVPVFEGVVAYTYYDQGSDMDLEDVWYVKISRDGVEWKPAETENYFEASENFRVLNRMVFDGVDRFIDAIREKRCPLCGRYMRIIKANRCKRFSETGAILRFRYLDLSTYDREEDYVFTCFKCGAEYGVHYDTWDGGAILNWRVEVAKDGRKAVYEKIGYYNNRRHFFMYMNFLKQAFDLGIVEVIEP